MRRGPAMGAVVLATALWVSGQAPAAESPLWSFAHDVTGAFDAEADPTQGNRIAILDDGYDALLVRVHLIRSARRSIDIQTFILANDECGRLLMYELIQAAKRGVKVRLLADHFMSARDRKWVAFLSTAHENFELKYYRPAARQINPPKSWALLSGLVFFRGQNQRMHNKVFVVDDVLAITGGRNIDNHYYNHSTSHNFIDRDVMIVGPMAPRFVASFERYWAYRRAVPSRDLLDVAPLIRRGGFPRPETRDDFDFNGFFVDLDREADDPDLIRERFVDTFVEAKRVELLVDRPGKNRGLGLFGLWGGGKATRRLKKALRETKHSLVFQSPYLILNWQGRRPFRQVRRRHPDVEFVISTNSFGATDNTLSYSANFKLRSAYIERLGFHIYEYKPRPDDLLDILPNYPDLEQRAQALIDRDEAHRLPFLCIHAKSFVRDDLVTYIGTYNLTPRSDNLNTEVGLLIEDEAIAKAVKATMLRVTRPGSSWVIAKRQFPLSDLNYLIEGISGLSPIDLWPLRNTTSFELRPGKDPVPPDHEDFYANYRDAGSFPGAQGGGSKEFITRFYKMLNTLAIPVL